MKRKLIFSFLAAFLLCLPLSVAAQKQNGHAKQKKSVKKELCLQLYSVRDLVHDINKDGKAEARWTSLLSRLHAMGYTSVEAACMTRSTARSTTARQKISRPTLRRLA